MKQETKLKIMSWVDNAKKISPTANQSNKLKVGKRKKWIEENPLDESVKKELFDYYHSGHGFKSIAKELKISYTQCRRLLIEWLGLEYRKGYSVITNKLREKRRENALGEKSNFYNWVEKYPDIANKNSKSIQGWYIRKNNKKVWLRSSLEYIYAKWLDENNYIWEAEKKTLKYKGETYRPDFFIYDKNKKLIKVVEIKGSYFDNVDSRSKKAIKICKENNIKLELIKNLNPYIKNNSYYHKELKEWKKIQEQLKEE